MHSQTLPSHPLYYYSPPRSSTVNRLSCFIDGASAFTPFGPMLLPGTIMVEQTHNKQCHNRHASMFTCLHSLRHNKSDPTANLSDSAQSTGRDTPVPTPVPLRPSYRCDSLASWCNNKHSRNRHACTRSRAPKI